MEYRVSSDGRTIEFPLSRWNLRSRVLVALFALIPIVSLVGAWTSPYFLPGPSSDGTPVLRYLVLAAITIASIAGIGFILLVTLAGKHTYARFDGESRTLIHGLKGVRSYSEELIPFDRVTEIEAVTRTSSEGPDSHSVEVRLAGRHGISLNAGSAEETARCASALKELVGLPGETSNRS